MPREPRALINEMANIKEQRRMDGLRRRQRAGSRPRASARRLGDGARGAHSGQNHPTPRLAGLPKMYMLAINLGSMTGLSPAPS